MKNSILRKNRIALLGCIVLAATLQSCSSGGKEEEKKQAAALSAPPQVSTFALQKGIISSTLRVPGELVAWQEVALYAKVSSFVKKLYVDVGSEVKQNQLLVTMEAPEIDSRLAGADSRLKAQNALYIASKANYDRLIETAKTPGTVGQNDIDQAMARMKSDEAQYQAMQAAYREAGANRNYLEIRAPFNGIISARNVNPGTYVGASAGATPMFTLQEQKKLRLVVSVPEASVGYLSDNDTVTFTVQAYPSKTFTANVKRKAGALDSRLRAERVEMDVYNEDKKLLPGMVAEVRVPVTGQDSAFIVPRTAVVNSTEKVFVIRIVNGKAEWINVRTGQESDDLIEVFGPMHSNDQLITTATEEVRDGMTVTVKK